MYTFCIWCGTPTCNEFGYCGESCYEVHRTTADPNTDTWTVDEETYAIPQEEMI